MNFKIMKYKAHEIILFAVESDFYVDSYCDTEKEAQARCDELNGVISK